MIDKPNLPVAPHKYQWLFSICLVVSLVIGSEWYWRTQGFMPRVVDSDMLWSIQRNRVYGDSTIVIVGSSRAQVGIDPEIMRLEYPGYKIVQLAKIGLPAFYTLQDLANDPNFTGIILYSAVVSFLANEFYRRDQKYLVDYYHREFFKFRNLKERIDTHVRVFLQNYLAILSQDLVLKKIVQWNLQNRQLTPNYYILKANRYRPVYYSKMPPESVERIRNRKIAALTPNPKRANNRRQRIFQENISQDLSHLYIHLRQRGGKLVFIRMPTSGPHWSQDTITYPEWAYWNKITEWTGISTIHFRDYPELLKYECPDTSHLDASDVPEFTRALGRIIRTKLK